MNPEAHWLRLLTLARRLSRVQLFTLIRLDFTRLARFQQFEDPGVLLGMRLHEHFNLFVHPPGDSGIVRLQQIVHRRAHQHRQAMRFAIIDREQRHDAGAAHFH